MDFIIHIRLNHSVILISAREVAKNPRRISRRTEDRDCFNRMSRTDLAEITAVRISTYGIVSESHRQGVDYLSPHICLSSALILRASSPLHVLALARK